MASLAFMDGPLGISDSPLPLQRQDGPAEGRRGEPAVHRARLQDRLGQLHVRHEERAGLRHGPHTQR